MHDLSIRQATSAEFAIAVDWAANEGWNPGIDDLEPFISADPAGYFMGWIDHQPVSSISVVKYSPGFGFLGFYIVHPDFRGAGHGLATWQTALSHLDGCVIGLDGVVDQQQNYQKSGFQLAGRNIRFSGTPRHRTGSASPADLRAPDQDQQSLLTAYDETMFGTRRAEFLIRWCGPGTPTRQTVTALENDTISGYATIRQCRQGYKIGPLFADRPSVADALFQWACASVPEGETVVLDVPERNPQAVRFAETAGLEPVFETARMYRGQMAELPWQKIYGVTTFELG